MYGHAHRTLGDVNIVGADTEVGTVPHGLTRCLQLQIQLGRDVRGKSQIESACTLKLNVTRLAAALNRRTAARHTLRHPPNSRSDIPARHRRRQGLVAEIVANYLELRRHRTRNEDGEFFGAVGISETPA